VLDPLWLAEPEAVALALALALALEAVDALALEAVDTVAWRDEEEGADVANSRSVSARNVTE